MENHNEVLKTGFVFNLNLVCGGYVYFTTFTKFLEFGCNNRERRETDIIKTKVMAKALEESGCYLYVITRHDHYEHWLHKYGWSIISEEYCRKNMKEWLTPKYCLQTSYKTFWDATILSDDVKNHSAQKILHGKILNRDNHVCKLCGKKSDDNQLTMHHIRPFSKGGMTVENNLLSLCRKCNENIGDEYLSELYEYIDQPYCQGEKFLLPFASNMMHARVKLSEQR